MEESNTGVSGGLTPAMAELERYFLQPRRWDIWDIEEGDESSASPVTYSPLATCPRVTPLDCVDREETLDELSSALDDDDEDTEPLSEDVLTARNITEKEDIKEPCNETTTAAVAELQKVSLPPLAPLEQLIEGQGELLSRCF